MVALNPAYAPTKSTGTAKNRVGDFFCESSNRVGRKSFSVHCPRLENEVTVTITASGLPYFLNADPIGFAGGLNWFAYAGGNPISNVDPSGLDYIGTVQYKAGALIYGYGTFEGRLYSNENPTDIIDVSGSLHGMGFQGGYITGEQEIRINADTPEGALGNQGGFFLADAGFGAGPLNIAGVGGSIGAHRGDNNADLGKASGDITLPGVSTGFDPTNPGSYLEKPRPGFGVSVGFFGTRVKQATRWEPHAGYYQPIPDASDYNFKTNIK